VQLEGRQDIDWKMQGAQKTFGRAKQMREAFKAEQMREAFKALRH
jgi:hypothetical protein